LLLNSPHNRPQKKSRRPTVLIVEDDIVIRSTLAEYLRATGHAVIEAANAAEAIALLGARVAIDVVFSDIRMPGTMDGLGLARWIRQHQPGVRLMLTSGDRNAARDSKIAMFVPKPYLAAEVAARVGQLLAEAISPASSPSEATARLSEAETRPDVRRLRRRHSRTRPPRRSDHSREREPDQLPELPGDDNDSM
jgi:CheY-like chemotaxis protein